MKRVFLGSIFIFFGAVCFAQELKSSQVRINGVVFTLGINKYETDYDLVFNKWYQGHLSSKDVKRGDSLDWINQFTGEYSIKTNDYDVFINNVSVGQDMHGILFSGDGKFLFIYDTNGVLRFVHLDRAAGIEFKPVKSFDIIKALSSPDRFVPLKDYVFLQDGILTEPSQDLTGLTELRISSLIGTLLAETKSAYDWVVSYETRTGKHPDPADRFTGLKYELSSVRIEKERQEKERLEREAQAKLEQERRAEEARIASEQQEKARLEREAQAKLEQERRAEEARIASEQQEKARLEREEQARIARELQEQEELKKLEQEMLAKRQLEEWRQAIRGISVVNTLIVNNGKEYQSIVVGKTSKADAIYILKSAFIVHAGALAATESYPGSNEYIAIHKSAGSFPHIVVDFKGNMVEKIRFQGNQRGEILYSFENEMYGILTVIPPDSIKLW